MESSDPSLVDCLNFLVNFFVNSTSALFFMIKKKTSHNTSGVNSHSAPGPDGFGALQQGLGIAPGRRGVRGVRLFARAAASFEDG